MLCLLFAELNSTAGLGPVNAVGVAVTFLVMVTLLPALLVIFGRWVFWPQAPDVRLAPSPPAPASGPGSATGSPRSPRTVWIVTAGLLRDRLPRACSGSTPSGLVDRGQLHQGVRLDQGPAAAGRRTAWSTHSNTVQVVANTDQADAVAGGDGRHRRARRARRRRGPGNGALLHRGDHHRRRLVAGGVRHRRGRRATRSTRSTGPTPWSVAARRSTSTPRSPPTATTR